MQEVDLILPVPAPGVTVMHVSRQRLLNCDAYPVPEATTSLEGLLMVHFQMWLEVQLSRTRDLTSLSMILDPSMIFQLSRTLPAMASLALGEGIAHPQQGQHSSLNWQVQKSFLQRIGRVPPIAVVPPVQL
jgi:hypothetical protein